MFDELFSFPSMETYLYLSLSSTDPKQVIVHI